MNRGALCYWDGWRCWCLLAFFCCLCLPLWTCFLFFFFCSFCVELLMTCGAQVCNWLDGVFSGCLAWWHFVPPFLCVWQCVYVAIWWSLSWFYFFWFSFIAYVNVARILFARLTLFLMWQCIYVAGLRLCTLIFLILPEISNITRKVVFFVGAGRGINPFNPAPLN